MNPTTETQTQGKQAPGWKLSRQTQVGLVVFVCISCLIGGELAFESWKGSETIVLVENGGTTPIEDFVLTFGGNRSVVGRIEPGTATKVFVNGGGEHPLELTFQQAGNPLNSIAIPEFSPAKLDADGSMLIIRVRPSGEIERFVDENLNAGTPLIRNYRALRKWLTEWISPPL